MSCCFSSATFASIIFHILWASLLLGLLNILDVMEWERGGAADCSAFLVVEDKNKPDVDRVIR